MERLPLSLLTEISIHLASTVGNQSGDDGDDGDGRDDDPIIVAATSPRRVLPSGSLARVNAFALSCRRCYVACNPVLYQTAIAIDLVRFFHRNRNAPNDETSPRAEAAGSAAPHPIASQYPVPPLESTELVLVLTASLQPNALQSSLPTQTQPPQAHPSLAPPAVPTPDTTASAITTSSWLREGALVISAAASGNIALLERLVAHFPSARLRRRLFPAHTNDLIASPCHSHAAVFYLQYSYFLPLPCASHFHWLSSLYPAHDPVAGNPQHLAAAVASPIHAAAAAGQDAAVTWLLDRGAGVDDLAWNCCQCPSPYMRLLFEHSLPRERGRAHRHTLPASISWPFYFVETPAATPLSLALAHGHQSTARLLIAHGAVWDRPVCHSYGVTPLHIMAAGAMTDLLRWIEAARSSASRSGPEPTPRHHDWPDDQGLYALHYAAAAGLPGLTDGAGASGDSTRADADTNLDSREAQELVNVLLRLGAVTTASLANLRRLVRQEKRQIMTGSALLNDRPHPPTTAACASPDTAPCKHMHFSDLTGRRRMHISWAWRMLTLLDDMDTELLSECPVAFAKGIGNNVVAAALSRRLDDAGGQRPEQPGPDLTE